MKIKILLTFILFFLLQPLTSAQLLYIHEQENYVNNLYKQMIEAPNADTKLRLHTRVQVAYQLTETNRALYKKDPVLYFINRDYYMPQASVNQPQYYKERFQRLDFHYDKEDIMYKLRTYLTQEEKIELAKELKFYKNLSLKEKDVAFIEMNYRYGNYYGKDYLNLIITDLLKEELISKKEIECIETIKKYQATRDFLRKYKIHLIAFFSLFVSVFIGCLVWYKKQQ